MLDVFYGKKAYTSVVLWTFFEANIFDCIFVSSHLHHSWNKGSIMNGLGLAVTDG